jgi:hypothetical protein
MRFARVAAIAALLALAPLAAGFARGAGGFTWGQQYWNDQMSTSNLQTAATGVYGYTTNHGGQRLGGFVMGYRSAMTTPELNGGFIGSIVGQEAATGPFVTAATLWTGIGGLTRDPVLGTPGVLALFGEADLELGLRSIPGIMLTGYAGVQVVTCMNTVQIPFSSAYFTPVLGVRLAWGAF